MDSPTEINWPKVTFSIIFCAFGLLGNALVIFVIVVLREYKKSVTHWYVLQLAIADSLFLATLPFKVSEDLNSRWIYQEWLCKAKETILFLNYYASIMFLMIMSADRYIALCHAFSQKLQRLRKPLAAVVITLATWVISLCMCVPVMLYSVVSGVHPTCTCGYIFPSYTLRNDTAFCIEQKFDGDLETCLENLAHPNSQLCIKEELEESGELYESTTAGNISTTTYGNYDDDFLPRECSYVDMPRSWTAFVVFNFVVMYFIPVIVMGVCYSLIIIHLSSLRQFRKSSTTSFSQAENTKHSKLSKSDKNRRRITIMCSALVTTFVILWLPFHVNHLAKQVGINVSPDMIHICNNISIAGSLLGYLNSSLNPYLYSFLGSNFKRRWKQATNFVCRRGQRRASNISGSSGVRFTRRSARNITVGSSSNNSATVVTKLYRAKHEKDVSISDAKQSLDTSHAKSDALHPVCNIPTNQIEFAQGH